MRDYRNCWVRGDNSRLGRGFGQEAGMMYIK